MSVNRITAGALVATAALFAVPVDADTDDTTVNFAVMRDGAQIGTNSVHVVHDGADTTVRTVTHVKVGFAFLTLYTFDQTETEHWAEGRLVAMASTTDDNGTIHRASAAARDGTVFVRCDGKTTKAAADIIPLNLWNSAVVAQNTALDTQNGQLEPLRVIDRGEQAVTIQGHTRRTHHYEIVTTFQQDVWYDDSGELVRVELKATDGSTILYQLV
ncbi:MAG TPA: DUF6134 family protein [Rhizomicrobium sp.]